MAAPPSIMALDIGGSRVGVALASKSALLPKPYITLSNDDKLLDEIKLIINKESVIVLVIGLPRSLSGNDTEQTKVVQDLANNMKDELDVPVYFQDEALTSVKAEEELKKTKKDYNKGDIDALAATYILEDYISSNRETL